MSSSEVTLSTPTQCRESVSPLPATKKRSGVQPSSSPQTNTEIPPSSFSSEVPPSHSQQTPLVSTVRKTIQNFAVPVSGSPLTSSTVSEVNNLTFSSSHARDTIPSTPNLPSYEQLFSDLVDYEEPPMEFSSTPQPSVFTTELRLAVDRFFDEVLKLKEELKTQKKTGEKIQARKGHSSSPAQQSVQTVVVLLYSGSYASTSVHENSTSHQHRPSVPHRDTRINPNEPEAIPLTEMSKGHILWS
ncbi:hypothetical protein P9112_008386 [Eukaryota sp. TZLM1-RC]